MLIWYIAPAIAGVLLVFGDPRLDHRLVGVGAVLPLVIDAIIGLIGNGLGRSGPFHALSTHIAVLTVAMLISIGKRPLRKRLLAMVIGMFGHLVLDTSWADTRTFGWPIGGVGFRNDLQLVQRGWVISLVLELIGIGIAAWLVRRCRLDMPSRRAAFQRTGSLELLPARRTR
jgi:hypothetical protein